MVSVTSTKMILNGLLLSAAILLLAGLGPAQASAGAAATNEFNRLLSLRRALAKIPFNKQDKEPHRSFIKRNEKDLVYSDPAGEWYVRSDRFWALQKKYHKLAIADRIAWAAAENPLPGECEGYVPCYLYDISVTYGRYLKLYPKGAHSRDAVRETAKRLQYIADDAASAKKNLDGPVEAADDAEFYKFIKELTAILARTSQPETKRALSLLKAIGEAYK